MSFRLPNGSTIDFASGYSAPVAVVGISNAVEAVVTATGHDFVDGDIVELTSGWLKLSGRAFKIKGAVAGTTFTLEGVDTTNTSKYPVDGGIGSVRKVTSFIQIAQILDVTSAGGEQQYTEVVFLEDSDARQIPTTKSPSSLTLNVADDNAQPFVAFVEAADEDAEPRIQRLNLVNGDTILYNSIVSFTSTPSLTRDSVMARTITLSQQGKVSRYAAN